MPASDRGKHTSGSCALDPATLGRLVKYRGVAGEIFELGAQALDDLVAGLIDPSRGFTDFCRRLTRFYVTEPGQVKCLPDLRLKMRLNARQSELKDVAVELLAPGRIDRGARQGSNVVSPTGADSLAGA